VKGIKGGLAQKIESTYWNEDVMKGLKVPVIGWKPTKGKWEGKKPVDSHRLANLNR